MEAVNDNVPPGKIDGTGPTQKAALYTNHYTTSILVFFTPGICYLRFQGEKNKPINT